MLTSVTTGQSLPREFYQQPTVNVSRALLGHLLVRRLPTGETLSGTIVETEAYPHGDPALYAYQSPTPRKAVMFGPAGHVYIYASHGVHLMLNIVCGKVGTAESVLIRAIAPVDGIDQMRDYRGHAADLRTLTAGPGRLTAALGLSVAAFLGADVTDPASPLTVTAQETPPFEIVTATRIGLSRGVELPWRFYVQGNPYVSRLG